MTLFPACNIFELSINVHLIQNGISGYKRVLCVEDHPSRHLDDTVTCSQQPVGLFSRPHCPSDTSDNQVTGSCVRQFVLGC